MKVRAEINPLIKVERERRAELSDIQNGTLRRLIGRVKLPRANQEDIGAVVVAQDGIVVQESDTKGETLFFFSIQLQIIFYNKLL